jgi:DNA-binding beta-propeller fold protein YncE
VVDRSSTGKVLKLSTGSSTQTELLLTGLSNIAGVAVGAAGAVYANNCQYNGHVLKLAAGSNDQTVLPFTFLGAPKGVAVDGTGAVYVCQPGRRGGGGEVGSGVVCDLAPCRHWGRLKVRGYRCRCCPFQERR